MWRFLRRNGLPQAAARLATRFLTRKLLWDLLGVAGLASIGVGLWWVYPPASLIALGAAACWLAVQGAKSEWDNDFWEAFEEFKREWLSSRE